MVLTKEPKDTSYASYIIARGREEDGDLNGKLILITVYEGALGEPEPYRNNYTNETAIKFWRNHALVPTEEERENVERIYTLEKVNKLFLFLNNIYA